MTNTFSKKHSGANGLFGMADFLSDIGSGIAPQTATPVRAAAAGKVLTGTAGDNALTGGTGDDTLRGLAGDDTLRGGAGNDLLDGGTGADILTGGTGNDLYLVDSTLDRVVEAARGGSDTVSSSVSFTLGNEIETLILTGTAALSGTGNALDNLIEGNAGANTLRGAGGVDTLRGNGGADLFDLRAGEVAAGGVIDGGQGVDILSGQAFVGAADLSGLTITNVETIEGFDDGLTLRAAQLNGMSGEIDVGGTLALSDAGTVDLRGAHVLTEMIALSDVGNTLLLSVGRGRAGGLFAGTVLGGAGADTVTLSGANALRGSLLDGRGGNDALTGASGADTLYGGTGADTLRGGAGNDLLALRAITELATGEIYDGGAGFDVLTGNRLYRAVDFAALGTSFLAIEAVRGFHGGATFSCAQLGAIGREIDIDRIRIADAGAVDLSGINLLAGDLYLSNGGNSVTLAGGLPGDLEAGGFAGEVHGGAGADRVVLLGGYAAELGGAIAVWGNDGNDTLIGADEGYTTLSGGHGADSVIGGAAAETFLVEAADELAAGEVYDGNGGYDRVLIQQVDPETGAVDLAALGTSFADFEMLRIEGGARMSRAQLEAFSGGSASIWGGLSIADAGALDLSDLWLNTGSLMLAAGGNSLRLNDDSAISLVAGGAGNDGITVVAAGDADWAGAFRIDGGAGNDTITGGGNRDYLLGGAGNDVLDGGAGGDVLEGGAGLDTLRGGAGYDVFEIDQAGLVNGEILDGGADFDQLTLTGTSEISLSNYTITGIEWLQSNVDLRMTAAQLTAFTEGVRSAPVLTLTTGGVVDLTGQTMHVDQLRLSDTATDLRLAGNGSLTGDFYGAVIGGAGHDTITVIDGDAAYGGILIEGGGGNDLITGGNGNDTLTGGAGVDTLRGGAGDDRFYLTGAGDLGTGEVYDGGAGDDWILGVSGVGSASIDLSGATLTGIEGLANFAAVRLTAAQADALQELRAGALTLASGGLVDLTDTNIETVEDIHLSDTATDLRISAIGGGSDYGYSSAFHGRVQGGAGHDTISVLGAVPSWETAEAGVTIDGAGGNDVITGGGRSDVLVGGAGADTLTGGAGYDRFVLASGDLAAGEVIDGGADIDTLDASALEGTTIDMTGVTLTSIEQLVGFEDVISDVASARAIARLMTSGTLTLSNGGTLDLQDSILRLGVLQLSDTATNLLLNDGGPGAYGNFEQGFTGTVQGGAGNDTIGFVASWAAGYSGYPGATLDGNGGADVITGSSFNDTLIGGAGADTLTGGAGYDRFVLVSGDLVAGEVIDGGADIDTLDASALEGATIDMTGVTLTSIEVLVGFEDVVSDVASARGIARLMTSGTLTLSNGGTLDLQDSVVRLGVLQLSDTATTVLLNDGGMGAYGDFEQGFTGTVQGGAGNDTIGFVASGAAGYSSYPGATLDGNGGADVITGSSFNDTLIGGAGADTLTGGAGYDRFVLASGDLVAGEVIDGGEGRDTLDGSAFGSATIDLSGVTLTSIEVLEGFENVASDLASAAAVAAQISSGTLTLTQAGTLTLGAVNCSTLNLAAGTNSLSVDISDRENGTLTINGNSGADSFTGSVVSGDLVIFDGGAGDDLFDITQRWSTIDVNGGLGNDTIYADNDNSGSFNGGAGDDLLVGGYSLYTVNFVFDATAIGGNDTISGFGFDNEIIGGPRISITGGASAVDYIGDAAFGGYGTTEVRWNGSRLEVDYDGDSTSDFTITLTGMTSAGMLGDWAFN